VATTRHKLVDLATQVMSQPESPSEPELLEAVNHRIQVMVSHWCVMLLSIQVAVRAARNHDYDWFRLFRVCANFKGLCPPIHSWAQFTTGPERL